MDDQKKVEEPEIIVVDLGDVMVETKQGAPGGSAPDCYFVWGIWQGCG